MSTHRRLLQALSIVVILTMLFSGFQLPSASAQGKDGIKRQVNAQTGKVSFLSPESGRVLSAAKALGISAFARPEDPGMALAQRFAPEFGLKDPARDLAEMKTNRSEDGRLAVRYQQSYQGIPVMGGELIVNTNENGDLYSINGEVSANLSLPTQPTIDSEQAEQTALQAAAKWYGKTPEEFTASEPELWIFDESLLQPSTRPPELVWRMEVTPKDTGIPVRELVLVNAERGHISLHFNQIDMAWEGGRKTRSGLNAMKENPLSSHEDATTNSTTNAAVLLLTPVVNTYTADNDISLPGTFLCNQADPTCADGDAHAKAAHQYAIGTYDFYAAQHGRDSLDNNGMTIISTVHYGSNYVNASWTGEQIIYGDAYDYPMADDVVAHEFTHGVTQYESNLLYYYQSGAINESLSDLWGEYYDQSNGLGTDTDGVKWEIGEDVHAPGLTRSMSNPTLFGDPDKMSSANYYAGASDRGGVHTNSGINNKAAYLMVNGGTFNNKTVSPLNWTKTAAIYYEANMNLITSGTDYSDLYSILQQACSNLINQNGITAADCVEVKDAVEAVEMNLEPRPAFNADAPYCDPGTSMTSLFLDDLESGTGNWTFNNGAYPRWQVDSAYYGTYARSGLHSLYADDYPDVITDATASLDSFAVPFDAYLRFSHAYEFESDWPDYYDGGVLEYSLNGGSSWLDARPLIDYNGYQGTLYTGADNPLSGRWAFVDSSHGYLSTRVNLTSLFGKTVTFRWRMGLDEFMDAGGWWVDDIELYQCIDSLANVSVTIGDTLLGKRTVNTQPSLLMNFPDRLDGPVKVIGKDGLPIVTSQRVFYGNSFNELMGYPTDQFTTEYWFPWYDQVYMSTWILVGNPSSTQTAYVDIYIGGDKQGQTYAIPPGGRVVPQFPNVLDGPVRVVSVTGSGTPTAIPIFTSERSTYQGSFNEVMGYSADQFTTEYWFPWYDQIYMNSWILVGNPSTTQTAYVDIYIGGVKQNQTYSIPPSGNITPQFPGVVNGPVKVVSVTGSGTSTPLPVFASERSLYGSSFNEVMGYPADQFTTEYWYTWYDNLGMASWILVGNPSTTQTAYVDIYIAGVKQGATSAIPPSGNMTPRFNLSSGPVQVVSVTGTGTPTAIPIFTSERSLYGPSFNEMMGYPADQLSSEYWFTWYDSVYMTTNLVVAKP